MTAPRRFRDVFTRWTPVWLSERPGQFAGETVGYRMLWVLHATIDKLVEGMTQAFLMALPGYGSPSALPLIGQSRGLLRGHDDTNAQYAARLQAWRTKWRLAGTRVGLATALHEYLPGRPRVDVVNRAGSWTRVDVNGTVTQYRGVAWNWDGTSNPERAGDWSDLWVIIGSSPYLLRGGPRGSPPGQTLGNAFAGTTAAVRAGMSLGMYVPPSDVADVKNILAQWKSAGSRIRAVVWNNAPTGTLFEPTNVSTLPDGTWGKDFVVAGDGGYAPPASRYASNYLRFWEPN